MDELTSPELIDSPELHMSVHALYSCCSDALKAISAVELHDERFKTYYARLKIWGAGLFIEGPSLDEILEEEPERYRPILNGLQKTLYSIAVEEGRSSLPETPHISIDQAAVVFLKSRSTLNGNHEIDVQLKPQTKTLLDLVSQSDTAVLACERRLPHVVNASEIGKIKPLTLQSSPSQDIRPSSSNRRMAREDQSLKSQGARQRLVNRISKKFPAGNEVTSLFTKKEDTLGRLRATSPSLSEHGLKEDGNASLSQPNEAGHEVSHEDYDMYLGDFVESLFDLLPSIRGIRRTKLLENEFHQSNKRSSSLGLVRQATPQAAQTLPGSKIQSDEGNTEYITSSFGVFESFVSHIVALRGLASRIYLRCLEEDYVKDVVYPSLGQEIRTFIASLEQLESIIKNAEEQSPINQRLFKADGTWATILLHTLWEVTGDFIQTLHDCEEVLSNKSVKYVVWLSSTRQDANDLRQRVRSHVIKILLICKPFELHLLRGVHGELQQIKKDVAPLKGILIKDTAQSLHPRRLNTHDVRLTVPPDIAERFEVQVTDPLPLGEGFDAAIFHLANSTEKFEPGSGPDQNIPEETQFVDLLKSAWIMEKLKDSDYLRSEGSESLWADCIRGLEIRIGAQVSRFDTGELEPPTLSVISGLYDHRFAIRIPSESLPRPPLLAEQWPLEDKILELALPSVDGSQQSTLTVFRESDIAFRLVTTTKDEQDPGYSVKKSIHINMNSTRFIPAFAAPDQGGPINNKVMLCNSHGQNQICYTFQDSSAIANFQRALLGYRVVNDMSPIAAQIKSNYMGRNPIRGTARLQLWQLKPLPKLLPPLDSTALASSGSSRGGNVQSPTLSTLPMSGSGSSVGGNVRASTLSSLPPSDSTAATSITGSRGDGIALARPEPPVLVIFTMYKSKYTCFHIKIEKSLSAEPVDRHDINKTCTKVIIQARSKDFKIRRLSAQLENEQGLDSWDLACFRYPEHPAFQNLEHFTKVRYMILDFETRDECQEFLQEFGMLEKLRDVYTLDYERTLMKYKATNYRQR